MMRTWTVENIEAATKYHLSYVTLDDHYTYALEVYELLEAAKKPLSLYELMMQWEIHVPRPTIHVLAISLAPGLKTGLFKQDTQGRYFLSSHAAIPVGLRFDVLKRDNYTCRLCGASPQTQPGLALEVDHITPRSKGGNNDPINLWTLCFACNRGKGTKEL
jgi:hypothetical protein